MPATMALMQSPQAPAGDITEAVGLTWILRRLDDQRIVSHGGASMG